MVWVVFANWCICNQHKLQIRQDVALLSEQRQRPEILFHCERARVALNCATTRQISLRFFDIKSHFFYCITILSIFSYYLISAPRAMTFFTLTAWHSQRPDARSAQTTSRDCLMWMNSVFTRCWLRSNPFCKSIASGAAYNKTASGFHLAPCMMHSISWLVTCTDH